MNVSSTENWKKDIGNLSQGFLHHAYLLKGDASVKDAVIAYMHDEFAIEIKGNPDVWQRDYESFGIDDGRALQEHQTRKAVVPGGRKIFVVYFERITREAQNALLKMFEEPTSDTYFFVVTPTADALLPTLQSRFLHVSLKEEVVDAYQHEAEAFVKGSTKKRFEIIQPFIDEKDKVGVGAFVQAVTAALAAKREAYAPEDYSRGIQELLDVESYLGDRASSVKMLLEHVALILPQV